MIKSNNLNTAIILAGGLGTRLRTVVNDRPKPMANIAGRPFLEHLLEYWSSQGIERFVISVGYLGEMISDHFGLRFNDSHIEYVVEAEPLGTGGALLQCQRQLNLKSPFLLLNGDTFFAVNNRNLNLYAENFDADWALSLFLTSEVNRYLPCHLELDGRLNVLAREPEDPQEEHWVNGGVYWVNPRALKSILSNKKFLSLEYDVLPYCQSAEQKLYGYKCSENFIDIGLPKDYAQAQSMACFN
jgi:D-glycero-alpha-D-manno-heptose 1-phosphate guanylyltransferase